MRIFLLALLAVSGWRKGQGQSVQGLPEYVVSECYGDIFSFDCGPGNKIRINRDFFGFSPNKASCSYGAGDCIISNPKSNSLVHRFCTGRRECTYYQVERRACDGYYSNYQQVEYQCVPDSAVTNICSDTAFSANSAFISSPNFPRNYPPDRACACVVTSRTPGARARLEIVYMAIKYSSPCRDWLRVGRRRMCGTSVDLFSGTRIPVEFRSDEDEGHSGFWLNFHSSDPDGLLDISCGSPNRTLPTTTPLTPASSEAVSPIRLFDNTVFPTPGPDQPRQGGRLDERMGRDGSPEDLSPRNPIDSRLPENPPNRNLDGRADTVDSTSGNGDTRENLPDPNPSLPPANVYDRRNERESRPNPSIQQESTTIRLKQTRPTDGTTKAPNRLFIPRSDTERRPLTALQQTTRPSFHQHHHKPEQDVENLETVHGVNHDSDSVEADGMTPDPRDPFFVGGEPDFQESLTSTSVPSTTNVMTSETQPANTWVKPTENAFTQDVDDGKVREKPIGMMPSPPSKPVNVSISWNTQDASLDLNSTSSSGLEDKATNDPMTLPTDLFQGTMPAPERTDHVINVSEAINPSNVEIELDRTDLEELDSSSDRSLDHNPPNSTTDFTGIPANDSLLQKTGTHNVPNGIRNDTDINFLNSPVAWDREVTPAAEVLDQNSKNLPHDSSERYSNNSRASEDLEQSLSVPGTQEDNMNTDVLQKIRETSNLEESERSVSSEETSPTPLLSTISTQVNGPSLGTRPSIDNPLHVDSVVDDNRNDIFNQPSIPAQRSTPNNVEERQNTESANPYDEGPNLEKASVVISSNYDENSKDRKNNLNSNIFNTANDLANKDDIMSDQEQNNRDTIERHDLSSSPPTNPTTTAIPVEPHVEFTIRVTQPSSSGSDPPCDPRTPLPTPPVPTTGEREFGATGNSTTPKCGGGLSRNSTTADEDEEIYSVLGDGNLVTFGLVILAICVAASLLLVFVILMVVHCTKKRKRNEQTQTSSLPRVTTTTSPSVSVIQDGDSLRELMTSSIVRGYRKGAGHQTRLTWESPYSSTSKRDKVCQVDLNFPYNTRSQLHRDASGDSQCSVIYCNPPPPPPPPASVRANHKSTQATTRPTDSYATPNKSRHAASARLPGNLLRTTAPPNQVYTSIVTHAPPTASHTDTSAIFYTDHSHVIPDRRLDKPSSMSTMPEMAEMVIGPENVISVAKDHLGAVGSGTGEHSGAAEDSDWETRSAISI